MKKIIYYNHLLFREQIGSKIHPNLMHLINKIRFNYLFSFKIISSTIFVFIDYIENFLQIMLVYIKIKFLYHL
jgi:hypothetical protein